VDPSQIFDSETSSKSIEAVPDSVEHSAEAFSFEIDSLKPPDSTAIGFHFIVYNRTDAKYSLTQCFDQADF
jgi:hypothetical protein